jgi:hypothetical protein
LASRGKRRFRIAERARFDVIGFDGIRLLDQSRRHRVIAPLMRDQPQMV